MSPHITGPESKQYCRDMKKLNTTDRTARDHKFREDGAIVLPAVLWWLGVPLSLLVIVWLFGML